MVQPEKPRRLHWDCNNGGGTITLPLTQARRMHMKVGELIKHLSKLDPSLEVYGYEEGPAAITDSGPFDVVTVSEAAVEMKRIDGRALMKFGSDERMTRVAILGLTPDF
jgi:hypothetical protein